MVAEIDQLRAEVAHLQWMVHLLADRNRELERWVWAATGAAGFEAPGSPVPDSIGSRKSPQPSIPYLLQPKGAPLSSLQPAPCDVNGGKKPIQPSIQNLHRGLPSLQSDFPNLHGGLQSLQSHIPDLQGGLHRSQSHLPDLDGGMKPLQSPFPDLDGGLQGPDKVLAKANGTNYALPSVAALMVRLKKNGMARIKDSGVERTARLMLWAARESGPISYAAMQQSFGMTNGGVAKLVASVIRRGWLRRQGVYAFALTDKGQLLLSSPG